VADILYDYGLEYGEPICMVTKATNVIMNLIGEVEDDLIERLAAEAEQRPLIVCAHYRLDGVPIPIQALSNWLRRRKREMMRDENS